MIKAGIHGTLSTVTSDLVRLLIFHPDVQLTDIADPNILGSQRLDQIFPSLFGDCDDLRVGRSIDNLQDLDVLFCTNPADVPAEALLTLDSKPEFRLIVLGGFAGDNMVYGVPELNRKAMVRGARAVCCPAPVAMSAELALFPLAKHLMLNSPITVEAEMTEAGELPLSLVSDEISAALSSVQTSFSSPVTVHATKCPTGIRVTARLQCRVCLPELERIYQEAYSDHNFTYLLPVMPEASHVKGTNKCFIHIQKNDDTLTLTSVIDPRFKGSAGNAVHCMNLLFGLHERTGLNL